MPHTHFLPPKIPLAFFREVVFYDNEQKREVPQAFVFSRPEANVTALLPLT
jgi:hypothetical protein